MNRVLVTAGVAAVVVVAAAAARQEQPFERGPGSRLEMALDANHDGVITASELAAASTAIAALDTNGDGRLTDDEVRPTFAGRRGRGPGEDRGDAPGGGGAASADDLADTLMAFDRNSDGRLERAEVPERFQGLFDRADANRDGLLTRDELMASATTAARAQGGGGQRGGREGGGFGRGRGGPMGDPLVRALDTDRDGALSPAEIAGAATALRSLDLNQDGQLSGDEIRPRPNSGRSGPDGRSR